MLRRQSNNTASQKIATLISFSCDEVRCLDKHRKVTDEQANVSPWKKKKKDTNTYKACQPEQQKSLNKKKHQPLLGLTSTKQQSRKSQNDKKKRNLSQTICERK